MEVAVVIRGVAHVFEDCGCGTNSDAEWLALIHALEVCRAQGLEHVELIGDAVEVVRQANRALRDGHGVGRHAARFLALAAQVRPARIRWIKRQQNLAGIALAARHPR
ncbi:ribonuclease HI [Novosphingobium resinovorum]|uniref:Ribonuclease HI n=1 Tax=Novosphingobium resinovorum TaxID=158500 RepID=A0A1D8A982_9SPHN|nr:ribonuclease HI [Novosphingobium resinovorum]